MDLLNKVVFHKVFQSGIVIDVDAAYITVRFKVGEKKFMFPDAFDGFLSTEDKDLMMDIRDKMAAKKAEKLKTQKEQAPPSAVLKPERNRSKTKSYARANIAFKCNYCDGGKSSHQIGYCGVCSDAIINNNIAVEHRTWCTADTSACLQYFNSEISRQELDGMCKDGGFVCYESQMLRDWKALAGIVQHGENKGKPMKLNRVQANSLCALTTRDPCSMEDERYIFAVFLVDETYDGDKFDEGYVSTKSKYKIKLSPYEAHQVLFWNYHANENQSKVAAWNSGLHRYFDDMQAAQILQDIARVKRDTEDEVLAQEFFDYFCEINGLNASELPPLQGALKI